MTIQSPAKAFVSASSPTVPPKGEEKPRKQQEQKRCHFETIKNEQAQQQQPQM